ncbi:MAG: PTS sugar transporter subunit IIA [Pseudomonadota bacterium]
MVGILVLTHGELGVKFLDTARLIGLTSDEGVLALSIDPTASPDSLRDQVAKAIAKVNSGSGVLILTDLFGGTPTNVSLSFLEEGKVEVVTGLNLPMLIKSVNAKDGYDLKGLAELSADAGKENIYRASDVLRQRRPKGGSSS